jgi:hypothetical protein
VEASSSQRMVSGATDRLAIAVGLGVLHSTRNARGGWRLQPSGESGPVCHTRDLAG